MGYKKCKSYCNKYTTYKKKNCPAVIINQNYCNTPRSYRSYNCNDFHEEHKKHSPKCYSSIHDYYSGSLLDDRYCNLKPNKLYKYNYRDIRLNKCCC